MIWYIIVALLVLSNLVLGFALLRRRSRRVQMREEAEVEEWIARIRKAKVEPPTWLPGTWE